jgi:subtilisin family serine protease
MNVPRPIRLALACCFCAGSLVAETNLVTLGKYRVHPTRILARYADQSAARFASQSVASGGGVVIRRFTLVPGLVVFDKPALAKQTTQTLTPAAQKQELLARMAALRDSGLFAYVEPDYWVTNCLVPTDLAFQDGSLWGLFNYGQNGGATNADIGAVQAWDITTGSTNVIVAVIDTGIRYTHKDLETQMWRNPFEIPGNGQDDDNNGYVDDVYGINAITGSGDPFDDNNHGTHVSGTIGAAPNNGFPHVGVSWHVQLMGCKFLDADGFGSTSDAIECIDYAVSKKARIMNSSWGGGGFSQALRDAIQRAADQGVLFVAAAGNAADNNDQFPFYPANYQVENVIAVAALDRFDHLAFFSNYGRTNVHLGAPGVSILSSTAGSDTEYQVFDGTSMAAPHVSGVAALVLSQYPTGTLNEVVQRLVNSTVAVDDLQGRTRTGGRVNAYNALLVSEDGQLEVSISPHPNAAVTAPARIPILVSVSDLFPITNATVTGQILAVNGLFTNSLAFTNNGRFPDAFANDNVYSASFFYTNLPTVPLLELDVSISVTNGTNVATLMTNVFYSVVKPPANDRFAFAAKVTDSGGVFVADNNFGNIEPGEPFHDGIPTVSASLWWIWTAAQNAPVWIDTGGSTFDTVLAVYTNATPSAPSLSTLVPVASVDDVCCPYKFQGYVTFPASAGVTYWIAVAGYASSETGTIHLRVSPFGTTDLTLPVVDVLSPTNNSIITDQHLTVSGTAKDPEPNASGVSEVFVSVNSGEAVFASGTTNWSQRVFLSDGVNRIVVTALDFSGNASTQQVVTVTVLPPGAPNDAFANALPIVGDSGVFTNLNNTSATKEPGEPVHLSVGGGKSLWWSFTAPTNGILFLSTSNSTFDTILAVYTGTNVAQLTVVSGSDDAYQGVTYSELQLGTLANETYHIAVDGYRGASGAVQLSHSFTPVSVVTVVVTNTPGGVVLPYSGTVRVRSDSSLTLSALPDAGYEFTGWNGSFNAFNNPLSFVVKTNVQLSASFALHQVSDDFESGQLNRLPWTSSGSSAWVVQTNQASTGLWAARSGVITHGQVSSLRLTVNLRAGTGSFDYKVSSEAGWDFLELYLNNTNLLRVSGEAAWSAFNFSVPAGTQTLEWRYSKDENRSAGLDAAFIDNVDLPLVVPVDASTPALLSSPQLAGGAAYILIQGQLLQEYIIQASTNLAQWQSVSTNIAVHGFINFVDPDSSQYPTRFYRTFAR